MCVDPECLASFLEAVIIQARKDAGEIAEEGGGWPARMSEARREEWRRDARRFLGILRRLGCLRLRRGDDPDMVDAVAAYLLRQHQRWARQQAISRDPDHPALRCLPRKRCSRCGQELPVVWFAANGNGRRPDCKWCRRRGVGSRRKEAVAV